MKRFLICAVLLLVVLALARALPAAAHGSGRADDDGDGVRTTRSGFFDHRFDVERSEPGRRSSSRARGPVRVGERIRFTYRDRGYEQVSLLLEDRDWRPVPMEYDPRHEEWRVDLRLQEGTVRYLFEVVDGRGRRRERTDSGNPRRVHDEDFGWVSELRVDAEGDLHFERSVRRDEDDAPYELEIFADGGLAYQRVDGLVAFVRPRFATDAPWAPSLDAFLGYGFSSDDAMVRVGLLQPLTADGRVRAVVSAYDISDYTDRNGVGDVENSLATLVFREDARDWFRREGVSLGVEAALGRWLLARVEMRSDLHASLERKVVAGWTGREDFLPNPAIDEGLMRSLFARVRLGDALNHLWLELETSDDAILPTEFDFTQLTAQYRARLRAGRAQYLDLRLRWGTALRGSLPAQKRYLAGGIGTVRGYRYQSLMVREPAAAPTFGGERLALANVEYVLGVGSDLALGLFADSGMVYQDRHADIDPSDWMSSVGLGFLLDADDEGGLRLDLIKPLDGDGDLMLQARLNRPF